MAPAELWILIPFVLAGAVLYTSVGHGGATIYLAILSLAGFAVSDLRTTVLVLNIVAAAIAFFSFRQAGHMRPRLLLPFVVASVPFAYLGGLFRFGSTTESVLLGAVLLAAGLRLLAIPNPPLLLRMPQTGWFYYVGAPLIGAGLGFLAGATGIGGGIFLSPVLLLIGWASVREAASIASAFIVLNSAAGLAANVQRSPIDTSLVFVLGVTVAAGAALGGFLGARRIPPRPLQALLGIVLLVASLKAIADAL